MSKMKIETLAERLKKVRQSLTFSQREMSVAVQSSFTAWQAYEAGRNIPGGKVLDVLAHKGFNVNWIFTGEGPLYLTPQDAKKLEWKEADAALRNCLEVKRDSHKLDKFLSGFPEEARITSEQLTAFINGEYTPTRPQLAELCRFAGGDFKEDEFIRLITDVRYQAKRVEPPLDADLLTLAIEAVKEIQGREEPLPDRQQAELICLVYQMNIGSKYTKDRLKRFIEAICVFIEQGVDFNKLSDNKMSNIIIQIAQHAVKGGEE